MSKCSLYLDPQSGFLADSQGEADRSANNKKSAGAAPDKAHITIKTDGSFDYDLTRERAHFQCRNDSLANRYVKVGREHKIPVTSADYDAGFRTGTGYQFKHDEIRCDDLFLHFRQKPSLPGKSDKGAEKSSDKEIETALATGKEVHVDMLASDKLEAGGTRMLYHCASDTTGPQMTITGEPMWAIKDGHMITAPELYLVGGDKKGIGQQAIAHGAGRIDMVDNAHPKEPCYHAFWQKEMSFVKITEKDEYGKKEILLDLLTLDGDAKFDDDERHQSLSAQKISVCARAGGARRRPGRCAAERSYARSYGFIQSKTASSGSQPEGPLYRAGHPH